MKRPSKKIVQLSVTKSGATYKLEKIWTTQKLWPPNKLNKFNELTCRVADK